MRARRMLAGGPKPGGPSQSPHKRMERRPRRNSDSSLLIDIEKPLTEEEAKQRDARRREREKRHRQHRPNKKVDVIDQLDGTSLFGLGGRSRWPSLSQFKFVGGGVLYLSPFVFSFASRPRESTMSSTWPNALLSTGRV